MNSTKIQQLVNKRARSLGWRAHKWERPGRIGANDYFYTKWKKKIVFIEFKQEGEDPSEMQKLEHKRLKAEGHETHVVDSPEAGYYIFAGR